MSLTTAILLSGLGRRPLADEYLDVRLSAAEALARLGPTARPALPALRQAAEFPNELLRETARHAISQVGSPPE